jgi:hypothetical protein
MVLIIMFNVTLKVEPELAPDFRTIRSKSSNKLPEHIRNDIFPTISEGRNNSMRTA